MHVNLEGKKSNAPYNKLKTKQEVMMTYNLYLVEMFDRENKGTINIHEFQGLFNYINQWKGTFESFDRDRSGYIEHSELSQGKYMNISLLQISMTTTGRAPLI